MKNEEVSSVRRAPSWVRYPWYYLFYVNAIGGLFAALWWFDLVRVPGGNETAFGLIIVWAGLSSVLLVVAIVVTLVWVTGRPRSPKS